MLSVLGLLAVTLVAVIAFQWVSGQWWVNKELEREARDVSRHFSLKFADDPNPDDHERIVRLVDIANSDPHIAFIVVRDANGEVVHTNVTDPVAFAEFSRVLATCEQGPVCPTCKSFPIRAGNDSRGRGATASLWTRHDELFGSVTVGIIDPAYHAIGAQLVRTGVVAGLAVGVVAIPLVAMGARRLAAPLRRVALAAEHLAAGRSPEPVPSGGSVEITSLASSFNRMAGELDAATRDLRAANDRLESTVRDRTRELRRVNARLELELTERARFFRAMSHDLGAPLRNIAGAITLLRQRHARSMPHDALEVFDRVERSVELELGMLRELLEISRLGAVEERPEPVETGSIARALAQTFDHDLKTRAIELVIRDPMPVVHVEGARFRQALQNLIDNAIKYMGDRPDRRVEISSRATPDAIEFSVRDTGPGIPAREHDAIFEVFRRASNAPRNVKGVGVGLAAVKAIVERWGGTIRVESAEGSGSRFIFTVPPERLVSLGTGATARARSENPESTRHA